MDLQLKGKTALVTGSTEGIGFSIAKVLEGEGCQVYINGRSQERVNEALKKISAVGIAADLGTIEGSNKVKEVLPQVDILINNMGYYESKNFEKITDEDWEKMFQVNFMSGVRLSRHYLPQMLKSNFGRIIFISSEAGIMIPPDMIHYGFSKGAQLSLSRGLAELTKGTSVTVNSILPGPTKTAGVNGFLKEIASKDNVETSKVESHFFENYRTSSLLKRFATTKEVATTVAYFASPLSVATNGSAILVEGGLYRSVI